MRQTVAPGPRTGRAAVPASKSRAHRLLICAAAGGRETVLKCRGISRDIEATIACLRAMGSEITLGEDGILRAQGRREIDPALLLADKPRDRHADAQQPRPVQMIAVQEILQLRGDLRRAPLQTGVYVKGQQAIGDLLHAQIRRHQPQRLFVDGDAHGKARVRHDGKPLRLPPAGGLLLPGKTDQPLLHELVQIPVQGGQADAADLRQRLTGAEALRLIERAVDFTLDCNMMQLCCRLISHMITALFTDVSILLSASAQVNRALGHLSKRKMVEIF